MGPISEWPWVAQIIAVVIGLNVLLGGAKQILDAIKEKTASNWDNKASEVLGKLIEWIGKLIDLVGMNPQHK